MRERAREEVKKILKEHHPQYVSEDVKKEINGVAQAAQRRVAVGGEETWDERCIESCDIFKDYETYYLYYHGMPMGSEHFYRIGVATASYPLGPWKKYSKNPILELGPEGSWDDQHVACAFIIKEGTDKYYM